jgi:hypothetical protein
MAKNGRPRKEISLTELDKLCVLQCLEVEIAGFFDMTVDTLETRVKEMTGMGFSEYFAQKRGTGKIALRRRQMQAALKGDRTMLVWLGKQYLDQAEKQETKHKVEGSLTINFVSQVPVKETIA